MDPTIVMIKTPSILPYKFINILHHWKFVSLYYINYVKIVGVCVF